MTAPHRPILRWHGGKWRMTSRDFDTFRKYQMHPRHDDFLSCQAAGMTVPEAAAYLGLHVTGIYRWAKRYGIKFANRKVPPPPNGQMPPEADAKRRAGHTKAMAKLRDRAINGWTWAALLDAGFTAREAAKMRGQTIEAAYKAEQALGRKFYRVHIQGLAPVERRKMHRIRRDYGVDRDTALTIMGRADLIQKRPPEEARKIAAIRAQIKADPEAALAALMRADAGQKMKVAP